MPATSCCRGLIHSVPTRWTCLRPSMDLTVMPLRRLRRQSSILAPTSASRRPGWQGSQAGEMHSPVPTSNRQRCPAPASGALSIHTHRHPWFSQNRRTARAARATPSPSGHVLPRRLRPPAAAQTLRSRQAHRQRAAGQQHPHPQKEHTSEAHGTHQRPIRFFRHSPERLGSCRHPLRLAPRQRDWCALIPPPRILGREDCPDQSSCRFKRRAREFRTPDFKRIRDGENGRARGCRGANGEGRFIAG